MSNTTDFPTINWQKLKDFCNSLTDEQLQQEVKVYNSDDEQPIDVYSASELGEDHYHFPEHDYTCTKVDFDKDCITDDLSEPKYHTLEDALAGEEHYVAASSRVYLWAE